MKVLSYVFTKSIDLYLMFKSVPGSLFLYLFQSLWCQEIWYYRNKKAHIFQLNRTEWSKWVVNLIQFAHMKHNQIFIRFPLLLLIYWRPLTISFILFWRFLFYFLHKTSSHQTDCMKEWIIHLNQFVFSILLGFYFV